MRITWLDAPPEPTLGRRLADFERAFEYPLGDKLRFRIDHDPDYSRFYRALGGGSFVAETDRRVLGVLSVAPRELVDPLGRAVEALYVGDVKLGVNVAGKLAFRRLVAAARERFAAAYDTAFAVVMDGTEQTPERYSGRAGIPPFERVGKIAILRVDTTGVDSRPTPVRIIDGEPGFRTFRRLARDSFVALPGDSSMRSTRTAEWLVPARADACGLLEDTRAAKRLFVVGGEEIRAAHLSAFAFANARAGAEVVLHACSRARESDVPFLFVAVPRAESATLVDALARRLDRARIVEAPATIYGFGLDSGHDWRIHTAEI